MKIEGKEQGNFARRKDEEQESLKERARIGCFKKRARIGCFRKRRNITCEETEGTRNFWKKK